MCVCVGGQYLIPVMTCREGFLKEVGLKAEMTGKWGGLAKADWWVLT